MKNFATLTFALAALSANAMATSVTQNCVLFPIQFAGGIGNGDVSCPGFNPGGTQSLDSVVLTLYADYTFGGAANDVQFQFTIGNPAGVTWAQSSVTIDVTGGFRTSSSSPAVPVIDGATGGLTFANFASAFNVNVVSSVIAGTVGTSSAGAQITYSYSQLTATPEPASSALAGSALIGLAFAFRKRGA